MCIRDSFEIVPRQARSMWPERPQGHPGLSVGVRQGGHRKVPEGRDGPEGHRGLSTKGEATTT
eukprot:8088392-Alexandrium_andersonii.AAC.1